MTDFCFISVAFGPKYSEQQIRLHQSITNLYPSITHIGWTDTYPPGAKNHRESLYGFKVDAIGYATKLGYKRVIWLDTAIVLQYPIEYWFDLNLPVVAAKDDNALSNCISDKALNYFGNPDIKGMHLVGGSVYVWDFNHEKAKTIFNDWINAERDGIFGSQIEQSSGKINRHRHDEACLAYLMQSNGVQPLTHDIMRYNQDENSIVRKFHFK